MGCISSHPEAAKSHKKEVSTSRRQSHPPRAVIPARPYSQTGPMELSDVELITLANRKRHLLETKPDQSKFKVFAILIVQVANGDVIMVEGSNAEQGYIGGAICAERAALCKLRFLSAPKILKVVIVTDSESPISPGPLCREYLTSQADPSVPVVIGNISGSIIVTCPLAELQPLPYIYRQLDRCDVEQFAMQYASTTCSMSTIEENPILKMLHDLALRTIVTSSIHPITFAAVVLFQDGTTSVARFLPGPEYGCSLDPVSQLVHDIDRKMANATTDDEKLLAQPEWLLQVDQFGVCHAPFAMARALLTEYNYGYVRVLYHDISGNCEAHLVSSLLPLPPSFGQLTHDAFAEFAKR